MRKGKTPFTLQADAEFIYFKTLLFIMSVFVLVLCIVLTFKLAEDMFVNPPPLLFMGERTFGMSTNYFQIEYMELSYTKGSWV